MSTNTHPIADPAPPEHICKPASATRASGNFPAPAAIPLPVLSVRMLRFGVEWSCNVEFGIEGGDGSGEHENPTLTVSHGGALACPPQKGDFLLVVPPHVTGCYREMAEAVGA